MINCEDCSKFAYDLREGSETEGQRILSGNDPIPISRPPCIDDDDVCPKGKPGKTEFIPAAAEVFWYWRLCESLGDHPDDPWVKRYRKMLERLSDRVKYERAERRRQAEKEKRKDDD